MAWLGFIFSITPILRPGIKLTSAQLLLFRGNLTQDALPTELPRLRQVYYKVVSINKCYKISGLLVLAAGQHDRRERDRLADDERPDQRLRPLQHLRRRLQ